MDGGWSCLVWLLLLEGSGDFFSPRFSRDLVRDSDRDLDLRFLRRLSERDFDLVEEDLVLFDFVDTPDLIDTPGDLDTSTEEEAPRTDSMGSDVFIR